MNPEDIISFFKQQGYKVIKTGSCWWYNEYRQRRIYYSFPQHRLILPDNKEIYGFFRQIPEAFALYFLSPFESRQGKESYIWVCRRPYDLMRLNANARSKVRRGMKNCQFRPLKWDELILLAWEAHRDTLMRHGKKSSEITSLGIHRDLESCPAYEAWGVFVKEHLAAYAVTLWVEDWVHILINRSANAYLKFYPNNALIFNVVQQLLARPGVSTVSYGLEPLCPLETLVHFKLSMGFTKEPVRKRIVLNPRLKYLLNPIVCRAIETVALFFPRVLCFQRLRSFCRIVRES